MRSESSATKLRVPREQAGNDGGAALVQEAAAEDIDRVGGGGHSVVGQGDVPGGVRPVAGLAGVPENRLLDLRGLDAGPAHRLDGGSAAEVHGRQLREGPEEVPDRCARAVEDHRLLHGSDCSRGHGAP